MRKFFREFLSPVLMFLIGWTVACIALLATGRCNAEVMPDVIGVHLGSWHSTSRDNVAGKAWNGVNPGIYMRWDNVAVGTYYNSIRRESYYVAYVYPVTEWLDVSVGAITGYDRPGYAAKPVMPMLVPSVHWPITDRITGRVHFAPQVMKGGASAIHLSLEFKL